MNIIPIKTEAEYRAALKQVENLMSAKADTPEGELLDILVTFIEEYERKAYPIEKADPVEVSKFYTEQNHC